MKKIILITLFFILSVSSGIYFFRINILRSFSNFLIKEDYLHPTGYMFVLSGDPVDRGKHASQLFKDGFAQKIICTGSYVESHFKLFDYNIVESQVTKKSLLFYGVPDSMIEILKEGTSTHEESTAILHYCKDKKIRECIIVSSLFHTRRVSYVFKDLFKKNNINLMISGAKDKEYQEDEWWLTEEGLLMVNNEFMKLIYYFLKY